MAWFNGNKEKTRIAPCNFLWTSIRDLSFMLNMIMLSKG